VYVCGITPYDVAHLGHAAASVWADALSRVLHAGGAEVIVCRNVADVDDVLLAAASSAGSPYDRFAAIQQFYFDHDMTALGVAYPQLEPRAHAHVRQVIDLAEGLLDKGAAYERDGQVYFRGSAVAHRAALDRAAAQGRPVRRGGLACLRGRGAGLGQSVGPRPPGPARRVRGDGPARVRPGGRRPGWRG
jgi:cysteinyl-tRNA synthetase